MWWPELRHAEAIHENHDYFLGFQVEDAQIAPLLMGMEVKLPNLGEGADSGVVVSILVKPGAPVKKGQNVVEIETGKAVAPIPSPADGTVSRLAVKEGDKLAVGQLILVLDGPGGATPGDSAPESASEVSSAPAPAKPKAKAKGKTKARTAPEPAPEPEAEVASEETGEGDGEEEGPLVEEVVNEQPSAGPYVRRVARDLGIDLRVIAGSGKSGQVAVEDLRDYVSRLRKLALRPRPAAVAPAPAVTPSAPVRKAPVSVDFAQWGPVTRKPLTPMRQAIAERMVSSATTIPTVTQFDEADVTALMGWRKKHASAYDAAGARLTLTTFVVKSVALMLRRHPLFNASLDEAAGEVVLKEYVHLGLAVDTEAGLLVPVIRDADQKDLVQLSKEIQDLATRARDRKVSLADMQGGTFTISNQGGIGGGAFTPIINQPEVAILGLGRSAPKPVVREGDMVVRTMMPLALTYDHRLVDGGAAARFMVDLVAALEGWREEDLQLPAATT